MEELKVKVVEVSQEKEQPQGNDYMRVTVELSLIHISEPTRPY